MKKVYCTTCKKHVDFIASQEIQRVYKWNEDKQDYEYTQDEFELHRAESIQCIHCGGDVEVNE